MKNKVFITILLGSFCLYGNLQASEENNLVEQFSQSKKVKTRKQNKRKFSQNNEVQKNKKTKTLKEDYELTLSGYDPEKEKLYDFIAKKCKHNEYQIRQWFTEQANRIYENYCNKGKNLSKKEGMTLYNAIWQKIIPLRSTNFAKEANKNLNNSENKLEQVNKSCIYELEFKYCEALKESCSDLSYSGFYLAGKLFQNLLKYNLAIKNYEQTLTLFKTSDTFSGSKNKNATYCHQQLTYLYQAIGKTRKSLQHYYLLPGKDERSSFYAQFAVLSMQLIIDKLKICKEGCDHKQKSNNEGTCSILSSKLLSGALKLSPSYNESCKKNTRPSNYEILMSEYERLFELCINNYDNNLNLNQNKSNKRLTICIIENQARLLLRDVEQRIKTKKVVSQDEKKEAIKWLEKAASYGSAKANCLLGEYICIENKYQDYMGLPRTNELPKSLQERAIQCFLTAIHNEPDQKCHQLFSAGHLMAGFFSRTFNNEVTDIKTQQHWGYYFLRLHTEKYGTSLVLLRNKLQNIGALPNLVKQIDEKLENYKKQKNSETKANNNN